MRHLRDNGSKMGIISTEIFDVDELAERLSAAPTLVGENLVKTVSCPAPHEFVPPTCLPRMTLRLRLPLLPVTKWSPTTAV